MTKAEGANSQPAALLGGSESKKPRTPKSKSEQEKRQDKTASDNKYALFNALEKKMRLSGIAYEYYYKADAAQKKT